MEELIDRIYEAAALPEFWPAVLDELTAAGSGCLTIMSTSGPLRNIRSRSSSTVGCALGKGDWRWLASKDGVELTKQYFAENWPQRTDRMDRLLRALHPGFMGDLDLYTREELDREAIFKDFLRPRGMGWGVATAITVPTGDMLVFDIERRLEAGPAEPETVRRLDMLRPHLARAGFLSCRLAFERMRAAVLALDQLGLPACLIGHNLRILAVNPRLEAMLDRLIQDRCPRISLVNRNADALLAEALNQLRLQGNGSAVRSIPVPASDEEPPMILHLIPIKRAANDIFSGVTAILVVTPVVPAEVPTAEVLQGLFDLTPAEARVARAVAKSETIEAIAKAFGVSKGTVRNQLKAVFAKTGVARQTDLALLLSGAGVSGQKD
jgi:DNA-binding CsgD family transcriptional regulator